MRILTMCQGGNVRSVGLAFVLKYHSKHDAIACSWEKNSAKTLEMLFEWAERIIVVQEDFLKYVPKHYHSKTAVYELGPDVWGNSLHPDLLQRAWVMVGADSVIQQETAA